MDGEKCEDVVTCFSPTIKVFVQISTEKLLHHHLVYRQECLVLIRLQVLLLVQPTRKLGFRQQWTGSDQKVPIYY